MLVVINKFYYITVKKVSNKERRRRQNENLRRLLTPKNALMVLNEMMPHEQVANVSICLSVVTFIYKILIKLFKFTVRHCWNLGKWRLLPTYFIPRRPGGLVQV